MLQAGPDSKNRYPRSPARPQAISGQQLLCGKDTRAGGRPPISLSGTGDSFRELMATASGESFVVVGKGEISNLLVRLAGLNVARALGVLVRGDKPIPVRCGLLDLAGEQGQMTLKTLAFDTANTVIYGEGKIDLRDEKINILVLPVPKDFSPFSLRSYIRIGGRLKKPSVFPDPIKTRTQSIIQKVFNVFTMLALTPFQPRDLGLEKDIDCDALIARVQDKDAPRVIPKVEERTTAEINKGNPATPDNAPNVPKTGWRRVSQTAAAPNRIAGQIRFNLCASGRRPFLDRRGFSLTKIELLFHPR